MNSRRKGKTGELHLVKKLKEYGYDVRRGQQYSGANGDADVVGIDHLHIEVKYMPCPFTFHVRIIPVILNSSTF